MVVGTTLPTCWFDTALSARFLSVSQSPMSGQTKPLATSADYGKGRRRCRSSRDDRDVVRFRTFPSEITRRLLATMAFARDCPRAFLIGKKGGSVGLVDIPLDERFGGASDGALGDGASDTGSSIGDGSKPAAVAGKVQAGKRKRERKPKAKGRGYVPSKIQMARTFSKCLPKQDVEEFEMLFKSFQGVDKCPPGCDNRGVSIDALLIKTRVLSFLWSLQRIYGVNNVRCECCDYMNQDRGTSAVSSRGDHLEIVAMDAVLSRTKKAPRRVTGTENVDTLSSFV